MQKFSKLSFKQIKEETMIKMIFWFLLVFSFLIRIYKIISIPGGVNQDEAMLAVDAWALSKYGTDRFGTFMPVHFTAWGYGQMSTLLAYLTVPFIKIFGFQTFAIRLPIAIISTIGIAAIYGISKRVFSKKTALFIMALTAINPWHFMQSRWALDCNLLPHIFLFGLYFLIKGFEKRKYLYLSMVFFGLTFYCYGVAIYTVPVFLLLYGSFCLYKKLFSIKEIGISAGIFILVALPEITTMAINFFGWPSVATPLFTMPYFPDSVRSNDILFLDFSFIQLFKNVICMVKQVFLQFPDWPHNAIKEYGPMYIISTPFIIVGVVQLTRKIFAKKSLCQQKTYHYLVALWCVLVTGIWAGLITKEININRINIIFYPLIILCGYGIIEVVKWYERRWKELSFALKGVITSFYAISIIGFFINYTTSFSDQIEYYFCKDFIEAVKEADDLKDHDVLYITDNMGWKSDAQMAEILTQYGCQLDAHYCQEITNVSKGKKLLPYSERYVFMDSKEEQPLITDALYVLHTSEINELSTEYQTLYENDSYAIISFQE